MRMSRRTECYPHGAIIMTLNAFNILVIVAGILAALAIIKPSWPLCPVAVLLLAVALLIK